MSEPKSLAERLWAQLPELSLPQLGREVEIPVYVIHNSADPEDYFFIFDFEQFVERSQSGLFVRPMLKVWAGRNDFMRRKFARQFRESFAHEFDVARAQLTQKSKDGSGWFSWGLALDDLAGAAAGFVANVVLAMALSTGRAVFGGVRLPKFLRGKSDEEKLEASIDDTKSKVDAALEKIEIVLHRDLYAHAYRGAGPGRLTGMEYDAWPLPGYVKQHLNDGTSGSWW